MPGHTVQTESWLRQPSSSISWPGELESAGSLGPPPSSRETLSLTELLPSKLGSRQSEIMLSWQPRVGVLECREKGPGTSKPLFCNVPGGQTLATSGAQHSQLPESALYLREPSNTGPPKDSLRPTRTWVTGDTLILLRRQCGLPFDSNKAPPCMPSELYLLPILRMEVRFEEPVSLEAGPHPVETENMASQLSDKGKKMDFGEA